RTCNLRLRRPTLYPVELRAHATDGTTSIRDSLVPGQSAAPQALARVPSCHYYGPPVSPGRLTSDGSWCLCPFDIASGVGAGTLFRLAPRGRAAGPPQAPDEMVRTVRPPPAVGEQR